ncbi:MAG TPA: prolyl oligopeptidase family serine peptidase [Candidatus Lustribacter sp.]|jgi:prolyl oligopeptidase|nr:prolyl oligopeptidase family serine peptidase [Candidatus Lustribacter sp.]
MTYPAAARGDVVDEYHGHAVPDPYRWLEDADAPASRAWIEAEIELTERFLAAIPAREAIRQRLTAVWDYERFGLPQRVGDAYVYTKNSGLQNQGVVYIAPALHAPARVLIDPNELSADGTVALSGTAFTDDGRYMAYATSASGSDWMTWRIREVATGRDLDDEIRWSKFSGASWLLDGSGFYYSRFPEPETTTQYKDENYDHKVYFHRVGTPQSADHLVYERPDHPDWNLNAHVTDDGAWLIVNASQGTDPNNRVFVRDLRNPQSEVVGLLTAGDASYRFAGNRGETFFFVTTKDAPRGRVARLRFDDPALVEIVPESSDSLEGAALFGEQLILEYLHDAHSVVRRVTVGGTSLANLPLPGLGSASGFGGKQTDHETFFAFTSYTTPASIYRLDLVTGATSLVFAPRVPFDPALFESEAVFYTSKDGTRIPMIVTRKIGTPRDGTSPMILYGYGGFNISLTPAFSPATLVWLEMGGAFAVANIRGGGEYGEDWHLAGTKERKQNVFDDFIAAAEYLIAEGYTSTPKLAIYGGSNGGLLVGACVTQRPDLFGAAVMAVGVLDMLRYQKFTIGWAWAADYGSSDEADAFAYLRAYSPLHNLRAGTAYPATLIVTADHDDRVFPAHSFKFAAALQAAQGGAAPVLIRIEAKAGHGAGRPTGKMIAEATDRFAFLVKVLDVPVKETVA